MATLAADFDSHASRPRPSLRVVADNSAEQGVARFTTGGTNWRAICGIAVAHLLVGALLITTGTVVLDKPKAGPVVVRMIPEQIKTSAPPPVAVPMEVVPVQVFVPPVEVQAEVVHQSPIAVTTVPPQPRPVAVVAPAAPSAGVPVPAPVTPPSFDADQLDNPAPRVPALSKRNHEQGTTMLRVLVSPDGRAQELKVQTSSGFKRLDAAALDAVRRWKFIPAKQAGTPVAAWVLVPITFAMG